MANRIDWTELESIANVYGTMAYDMARAMKNFYDSLEQRCRGCAYKPMVDFTNKICNFYYGEFKTHMNKCIHDWNESDHNLKVLALKTGAGDEAASIAQRYMDQILENLNRMFDQSGIQELKVDTAAPVISEKAIAEVEQDIRDLFQSSENIMNSAINEINRRGMDNNAFYTILGPTHSLGDSVIETSREMIQQILKGSELFKDRVTEISWLAQQDGGTSAETGRKLDWPFDYVG